MVKGDRTGKCAKATAAASEQFVNSADGPDQTFIIATLPKQHQPELRGLDSRYHRLGWLLQDGFGFGVEPVHIVQRRNPDRPELAWWLPMEFAQFRSFRVCVN